MKISQRPLTIDDAEQLINIVEERPEVFMTYTDDHFKNELISNIPQMLQDPYYFNIGLFVDGVLEGAGMMKEFKSTPAWCWAHWVLRKTAHHGRLTPENTAQFKKVMKSIDEDLFDEMEVHRKLNRFFFCSLNDNDDKNKLRSINSIESYHRVIKLISRDGPTRAAQYQVITDCVVEPYTLPKYSYQQEMTLNRTWPIKLRVSMAVLQP
jgi:hypothetical protein